MKGAMGLALWLLTVGFSWIGAPAVAQDGETYVLPGDDQCVTCHLELDEEQAAPVEQFRRDVHLRSGLSCADCHGGNRTAQDADAAMDPAKGFVGAPDELQIPRFCDRCHGDAAYMRRFKPGLPVDQLIKYRTSVHGERNRDGDRKAAQCASCHPAHRTKPANDPTSTVYPLNIPATCGACHADARYMADYDIPTDQLVGYTASVHGQALLTRHDLGAPACNNCHGNHAASPPITASIANVCGNCHAFNAELFAHSPHRVPFEENEIPACEICHGEHAIRPLTTQNLGTGAESICMDCHSADDGTHAVAVAVAMQQGLDSLERAYTHADSLLHVAERKGMFVEEAAYELTEVRQAMIQAHTLVHSFSDTLVGHKVDSGLVLVAGVTSTALEKIGESTFRRLGLLVSTLIISFLVVVLYLKIRSLERRSAKPTST